MNQLLRYLSIFLLSTAAVILAAAINVGPHTIKGTIYRPLVDFNVDFQAWYEPAVPRSRIDYFQGATKTYQLPIGWNDTQIFKIFATSDGQTIWPNTCFEHIFKNQIIDQPAIAINMRRDKSKTIIFNGVNCTLFWDVNDSSPYRTIEKYWVRYQNSIEIPVRYEKRSFNPDGIVGDQHYILDYFDYKPGRIAGQVFHINPEIINNCTNRTIPIYLNPMNEFITRHSKKSSTEGNFKNFIGKYEKSYGNQFKAKYREKIFRQNSNYLQTVNSAKLGYKLAINRFADWTNDEYLSFLGEKSSNPVKNQLDSCLSNSQWKDDFPDQLDLRMNGFVTPVKDQQNCASSHIFAIAGVLEGAYFKRHNTLVKLSEQAMLDCAWGDPHSNGCFGGNKKSILHWVKEIGGIPQDGDYYRQYSAIESECRLSESNQVAIVDEICEIQSINEMQLKQALMNYGPVAVSLDASSPAFAYYSNGVYFDKNCSTTESNHNVLIVGYGELDEKVYWLIKNSWGSDWGINGYMLISREGNTCGILNEPVAAKLKHGPLSNLNGF